MLSLLATASCHNRATNGRAKGALWIAGVAWAMAVLTGIHALARHAGTPGPRGADPDQWPAESRLSRPGDRPLLLVFAHPRCPCLRATFAELIQAQEAGGGEGKIPFDVTVVFYQPDASRAGDPAQDDWQQTEGWRAAQAVPGVRRFADAGAREALRFGVQTSGHLLLFSPAGKLLFSGGITGSRGHLGDNAGEQALLQALRAPASDTCFPAITSVYGCPLYSSRPLESVACPR